MTLQDKKNYLAQYRSLNRRIVRNENEIQTWRSKAEKITATIGDMIYTSSGYDDKIQSTVEKICAFELEIAKDNDRLITMRMQINTVINSLENETYRDLLILRYIDGFKFEHISLILNYGYRHLKRIHNKAIMSLNVPQT